jgi:CysZ protein
VTLPLWLTGIAAVVLPALLSAYLSQRLFRYDALAEHATAEEYRRLARDERGRLYLLGLMLAGLYYVPVVNLIAPTATGLAYTHYCLDRLARLRQAGAR